MDSSMSAEINSPWELAPVSFSEVERPKLQGDFPPRKRPTSIRLPDMFSSILSATAVVNPHYHAVKEDGDRYIGDLMGWDEKARKRNSRADFALMSALWSPEADHESLRVVLDWNNWVFLFDDQFDEGHLKEDLVAAQVEITAYLAIIDGTARRYTADAKEDGLKLRYLFQTCLDRVMSRSNPVTVQRFQEQHKHYFAGLMNQVEQQVDGRAFTRSSEEYIKTRRGTIAVCATIVVCGWSEGIQLGSEPFKHPSLQQCMLIATDLIWMANDIVSFGKDLMLGVDHNYISVLMEKGHSMQEAVDKMGHMFHECYRRWYLALADLPVWGEAVDREALRFIDLCRNMAVGNLHWSFKTGRYFGVEGDEVRETRVMHLPPQE